MHWRGRTIVRLFLLTGGTAFLVTGALGGDVLNVVLGAVAASLGGVGLASEWTETIS
ncbi:hypothetical protein [Natronobacterium gregoryi]|uniref:Uncharacterized protein n=2 Tax=Natronobacterium gregoryi TaxID=44930 RepID=L0AJR3_NATGS|nr:hypothetical protein [Natronobacterium gregoryi]AFZ74051.1 hypothetical protein Natgr_2913 [Natronobacterium gregoryi SP2]SFJ06759.1 hypothetical protein SAMN05443661_11329 [Natronobacterium gregoryi]